MFDSYLVHQQSDPQLRYRMMFAMCSAVAATMAGGLSLWTMEKLQISYVSAPKSEFLIFALDELEPPPPAKPPAARAAAPTPPPEEEDAEEEPFEEDPMTPPDKVPHDLPKAKTAKQVLEGVGGGAGNPLGKIGGDPIGTCLFNCDESIRIKDPVGTPKRPPPEVDFSALTCRVCPDPPQKELQLTSAAVMGKKGVSNRTRFCVESTGRVSSVVTSKRSGDADIDRIVKTSVRQWRFAPMLVDGRPRKTCSTASFDIQFE